MSEIEHETALSGLANSHPTLARSRAQTAPQRRHPKPTPTQKPTSTRIGQIPRAVTAACIGVMAYLGAAACLGPAQTTTTFGQSIEKLARATGFGIDQISLTGAENTPNADIFAALQTAGATTFFNLDVAAAHTAIAALPWVNTVEIQRVYPGTLFVVVVERTAVAILERAAKPSLMVDETGRVLGPVTDPEADMLRVRGTGAEHHIGDLQAMLAVAPVLQTRLAYARWISQHRWTLVFDSGTQLALPAENPERAIRTALAHGDLAALIGAPNLIVDVRAPTRITMRARAAGDQLAASGLQPGHHAPSDLGRHARGTP